VQPDLVCGTSVGAINGAALAADPAQTFEELAVPFECVAGHAHR
jgi:predicted acylesterase/phospholipase RssA